MAKFWARSLMVEAVCWDGDPEAANAFVGERYGIDWQFADPSGPEIAIGKSNRLVYEGDWIVKTADGQFFTCNKEEFPLAFQPVERPCRRSDTDASRA